MPVELAATEEAARGLIELASAALGGRRRDIPRTFIARLFGRSVPEDLLRYGAEDIAALAERAYDFIANRTPGAPKIRCETVPLTASGGRKSVSVIEIDNDDMPFLVDSVTGEIAEHWLDVCLVAHPMFGVQRRGSKLIALDAPAAQGDREIFIHIHLVSVLDDAACKDLVHALQTVLGEVRVAVQDWRAMRDRVNAIVMELKTNPPPLPVEEVAEAIQFLEWLLADNFTFLGVRNYRVEGQTIEPDFASALGIMRSRDLRVLKRGNELLEITPEIMAFLKEPRPLIIAKANIHARVHRRVYMDYVGVKRFDRDGKLVGEFRIVGLFASTAYTRAAPSIPYLRRKIAAVETRAGFDPSSHSSKALANVLEQYPRDELFQVDEDTLYSFALAILQLEERPRVRVLARHDRFDRFVSVLVFVPRQRYDSDIRAKMGAYLARAFIGRVSAFYPFFPGKGPLVRVHFIIGRSGGATPEVDRATLEREVAAIIRTWSDGLSSALALVSPPDKARELFNRYRDAFSEGFHEAYAPTVAASDIRVIEGLSEDRPLGVDFHHRLEEEQRAVGLKVWTFARPLPLSERVPVLESMGFRVVDERTYRVEPKDGTPVWLHDMLLERADGGMIDLDTGKGRLESAFLMVMRGIAENDGYNALTLHGGLAWRDVALIRTISRFLRQISVPYSQDYMWATLVKHAGIAAEIVELFHARFDPRAKEDRPQRESTIVAHIEEELQTVESLDEDRILRRFVNAVQCAVRTSFFQTENDGQLKALISLKFESRKFTDVPLPRPFYEIFVYSPRVEGVHMRFGKVARGGIRWSDRPQDFRTEILGLAKAQQVKNAVIVPVGAKGGFVPKLIPKGVSRDIMHAEGVATYKLFISALLDVTDNIASEGKIIPPSSMVRHDGDDPYLVVTADKDTATFSDIANTIARERRFWLDDAFASGSSAGYDHKKMGITARGAWESIKRHFREMNVDIGMTPFTVVGVGDMSGDIFGNGMLRERTIKLVAAFDHRDIFIDPSPDPDESFAERKRLFELPRSSWQDYDKTLLSTGGGVYSRAAKAIELSREAQSLLGITRANLTPAELISAVLKMPVDLLFFGGIGTYVRASSEAYDEVGDRANDAIRIPGTDLRCKVIGEGADLGMTQRGRIEAALHGVRLNTDTIDNSASVNASDVEVNLKITLSVPMRDGRLTRRERNQLLVEMTDQMAHLVLCANYQQTLAISLAVHRGLEDLGFEQQLMHTLEERPLFDRAVEFLPDDVELAERRHRGQALTRPELAVLLGYAKLALKSDLMESSVPDDPYLAHDLERYFPPVATERFGDAIERHPLRREIIATQLTDSMINHGGPSLIARIADATGASSNRIAVAFAAVRDIFRLLDLNGEVDALDNKIEGNAQLALYAELQNLLLDRIVWFLRRVDLGQGLTSIINGYQADVDTIAQALDRVLPDEIAVLNAARIEEMRKSGVPTVLAHRIADLRALTATTDIALVAKRTGKLVTDLAATYFATVAFFRLDRIVGAARDITLLDNSDRLALDRALDQIGDALRRLTADMSNAGAPGRDAVERWVEARGQAAERTRLAVHEITASGLTLSRLAVAASLLNDLAG